MSAGRVLALLAGLGLAALGVAATPDALVPVLDPAAQGERTGQLRTGVQLFRALLGLHAVWLGVVAWRGVALASAPSLWQPPPQAAVHAGRAAPSEHAVLCGLLVLAAALRWIGIHQDLWLDEVFTLVDFVRPPLAFIVSDYHEDNQHLLYSVLAHLCTAVFGESAAAVRLPAVVLGVVSLGATWRLARLVTGSREALLATALLAFSYHHVWFSQNARGYTGLLLATVLATDLLLRGLWQQRSGTWLAYAATLVLGMGLHLTMIFVPAAHGLLVLWLARSPARLRAGVQRPLAAFALAGTLTLQLYALMLPQMVAFYTQPAAGTTDAEVEWKNPLWLIHETIRGLDIGLGLGWAGVLGGAAVFAVGGLIHLRRAPLATLGFVLPAVLGAAVLVLLERNLWPRFFFNEMAFAAFFAIGGLVAIGDFAARRLGQAGRPLGLALAGALVVASAATVPRAFALPKQDYTGARDWVQGQLGPGDRVVGVGMAGKVYRAYYAPDLPLATTLEELERERSTAGRTWVVYTLGSYIEATRPELWHALETRFEEVRAFPGTLSGGAIVVRRSLPPPP